MDANATYVLQCNSGVVCLLRRRPGFPHDCRPALRPSPLFRHDCDFRNGEKEEYCCETVRTIELVTMSLTHVHSEGSRMWCGDGKIYPTTGGTSWGSNDVGSPQQH